jgi:hypothetical protein
MIQIKTRKHGIQKLSVEEFARWASLIEAYEFIRLRADQIGVDIEGLIKPAAIDKYIEERYPSIVHDVKCEHRLGLI